MPSFTGTRSVRWRQDRLGHKIQFSVCPSPVPSLSPNPHHPLVVGLSTGRQRTGGTHPIRTRIEDYILSRYPLPNRGCSALKLENARSEREERTSPAIHRALCIQREVGRVVFGQRNSEWYKGTCPEWRNHANCLHQSRRTPPKMKRERGAPSRAFSALSLTPFVYLLLIQTGRRPEG